ncbi:MAG: hypothetical protein ACRDSF_00115 [Pseudonocardiaceae bacterium]
MEPFEGNFSHGPKYGEAFTYRCFVDDGRTLQLDKDGAEVVSSARAFGNLIDGILVESRVTVNGKTTYVIDVKRREGKGLPTPDHLEIILR